MVTRRGVPNWRTFDALSPLTRPFWRRKQSESQGESKAKGLPRGAFSWLAWQLLKNPVSPECQFGAPVYALGKGEEMEMNQTQKNRLEQLVLDRITALREEYIREQPHPQYNNSKLYVPEADKNSSVEYQAATTKVKRAIVAFNRVAERENKKQNTLRNLQIAQTSRVYAELTKLREAMVIRVQFASNADGAKKILDAIPTLTQMLRSVK